MPRVTKASRYTARVDRHVIKSIHAFLLPTPSAQTTVGPRKSIPTRENGLFGTRRDTGSGGASGYLYGLARIRQHHRHSFRAAFTVDRACLVQNRSRKAVSVASTPACFSWAWIHRTSSAVKRLWWWTSSGLAISPTTPC